MIQKKAPWHLWLVGILGTLWSAVGAFDYVMTQTKNEAYMSNFSVEQLEYFYSFPMWVEALWALAVWGGLLGCIMILLRKGLAVPLFVISLVTFLGACVHNFILTNGAEIMGPEGVIFSIVIFVIPLFLLAYSVKMRRLGYLSN